MVYRIYSRDSKDNMVLRDSSEINLPSYDRFVIAFSGGKDSLACILHLLEMGVPRQKIELWHHCIDGDSPTESFMDWPVTRAYVKAIAHALQLPLYYSWRVDGYRGELLRNNSLPHDIMFETPAGIHTYIIKRAVPNTRRKFPLVHATDLNKRWCTSALKIDVGRIALSHQERFLNQKTCFISGERAEESAYRARYNPFEIHKMDNRDGIRQKRWIDAWRPVHAWKREDVWEIIERWKINPHPCYRLGWGRCSCALCIFSSPDQVATLREISPKIYNQVLAYEIAFNFPIHYEKKRGGDFRKIFIEEYAAGGNSYQVLKKQDIDAVNSSEFLENIFQEKWQSPRGRWGDQNGPL